MKLVNALATFLALAATAFSVEATPDAEAGAGEKFFHQAGVAFRLYPQDSLVMTVAALSEDLQNTVGVFPYMNKDTAAFRLMEKRLEAYFQQKIVVRAGGKRLYFKAVQWKPGGQGLSDGLDSLSLNVDNLIISMGTKLPKSAKHLDVTVELWLEREDAGETLVEVALYEGRKPLRRLWTLREKRIRLPLHPDSLARMRADPPPPASRLQNHSGHSH